jgi:hypothetical protein
MSRFGVLSAFTLIATGWLTAGAQPESHGAPIDRRADG